MPRILVICLSEATLNLALPWARAGLLPTLARLTTEGCVGNTSYGIPCLLTPQLWTTVTTGRSAGHHGIFDYWQRGPDGRFQTTSGADVQTTALWDHLSGQGKDSIVVNLPHTYPPRPARGILISGQDAPGLHDSIARPTTVMQDIAREFGRYRLKDIFPRGQTKDEYRKVMAVEVSRQTDILEYLMRRNPWQFFMAYYSVTAMAQHYFWSDLNAPGTSTHDDNAVLDSYIAVDKAIGRLIAAAGNDTITFVISECGAGPLESGVQMNAWLEKEGLLNHRASNGDRKSAIRATVGRFLADVKPVAQRVLPQSLLYRLNRSSVKSLMQSSMSADVDWSTTKAYYHGKGEGNIYINLRGRDPHGIVEAGAEYEDVREQAIERLCRLVGPDGERVVDAVHKREDLFRGPSLSLAPDLIVRWKNFAYMPNESSQRRTEIFGPRWREFMSWPTSGSHRMRGVFVAHGPGVEKNPSMGDVDLLDLAPTWLNLMGIDTPPDWEGRPISPRLQTRPGQQHSDPWRGTPAAPSLN